MYTYGTALLLLLLAPGDVRGASVTSSPANAAGTSLLLRHLEDASVSNQQRVLLSQLGINQSATSSRSGVNQSATSSRSGVNQSAISTRAGVNQSATGNNVGQPKVAERSQPRSVGRTPKPRAGVIYKGQHPPFTHQPSPFVQKPAPNLAAGFQPPGHGFPDQRPPLHNRGHQFPNQGPQFPNQGPQLPKAAARFPGPLHQTPGAGPQFPGAGPQFPSEGPAGRGPQHPHPPPEPLPGHPPSFPAAVPSPSPRAVNPLGSALRGFGTSRLEGQSSFPPPPLEVLPPPETQYSGIEGSFEGRSLPVAAATPRQRRANWRPGHPFQGQPLEGTYLDPLQQQKMADPLQRQQKTADPTRRRQKTAAERDTARPLTEQAGQSGRRRASRRQRQPQEVQRDHYNTLHRESFSRQRVEPVTDSAEFFGHEERDGDKGHRHALGQNHGYPRDHAARHVYGDGHRAGDPYNIRPTDKQVQRGYAREEEHDHYYSRQRFDNDAEFSEEEKKGDRRQRPTRQRKRTRRPQPRQRYTDYAEGGEKLRARRPEPRPEYDDYEADVRDERRGGDRQAQRQQAAPPVYDDYGDFPADYPADYADDDYVADYPADYTDSGEARVSVLEDSDDFRPERRPTSRARAERRPTAADVDVYADGEAPQRRPSPPQRRPSSERDDPRDHYAPENYGRTSQGGRQEAERRQTSREARRLPLAERDSRAGTKERLQGGYRRRQRRAVTVQDLKELAPSTSSAFRSLARAMEKVRRRRQAADTGEETTEPLGSSEMEYQRNPHNPVNSVQVPEVGSDDTPSSDRRSSSEQQQQQQKQQQQQRQPTDRGLTESDSREAGLSGSQQEDGADRDSEGTSERNSSADAGHRPTPAGQADQRHPSDFSRSSEDASEDYQPPVWWESVRRGALTSSARRSPNSVTYPATAKHHQKWDAFGRVTDHAEFGSHFPSPPFDRTFQKPPSVYISEESIPSWRRGYEGSLERRQRHAAPSVGDGRPLTVEIEGHQRQDDGVDDSDDAPGSFAEIEPVQTNQLHSDHSKLGSRQRLQQLIGSDDVSGPGGYHESLGSRRPGGVPSGDHDDRRHHGDDERYHDDEQRHHGEEECYHDNGQRHHGDEERYHDDERRGGDHHRRPTEDERRPARPESSDEGDYLRQLAEAPHRRPAEEERRRYPGNGRVPDEDRRRPADRPEDARPDQSPNYYVITPNELASDDITSYEKPSRPSGGRGQDRDRRPPPPPQYHRPEQEDGRYDDRRPDHDRQPDHDHRPDHDRRPDHDHRPDHDRRPDEDERKNSVYNRLPSDEERGEGDGRYYSSRRPQDDGRRHPEDERRHPEDERRYAEDEKRHSEDERRHPEDKRRYPEDERRYPEDERRYPEDERRYASADNTDGSYHSDDRRPSEDSGYHGDDRRPSEDGSGDDSRPSDDSGGRRHLHAEPEERPQYYREPDSRYPDSAEDTGEGGYYRRPHPEEVEQEQLYGRPETGGQYYSEDERREGEDSEQSSPQEDSEQSSPQEDSQQAGPQETEEDLYSGPNQGYYDDGAPGYYGNDGPSFTQNHDDRRYNSEADRDEETYRDSGADSDQQPVVTSPVRDVTRTDAPDQSEADRQVSSFINQMFKEYDPFRRSEQSL